MRCKIELLKKRDDMPKQENNILIYQDEDGITKVSVKFSDEDV